MSLLCICYVVLSLIFTSHIILLNLFFHNLWRCIQLPYCVIVCIYYSIWILISFKYFVSHHHTILICLHIIRSYQHYYTCKMLMYYCHVWFYLLRNILPYYCHLFGELFILINLLLAMVLQCITQYPNVTSYTFMYIQYILVPSYVAGVPL